MISLLKTSLKSKKSAGKNCFYMITCKIYKLQLLSNDFDDDIYFYYYTTIFMSGVPVG